MENDQPQPKQPMDRWAKAYLLALVIFGVGVLGAKIEPGGALLSAGLVGSAVCAVIGTVWVVKDKMMTRRN